MTDWTAEEERVARAIVEAASGPFNVLSVRGKEAAIREARAAMSSWRDVKTDPPPVGRAVLTVRFGEGGYNLCTRIEGNEWMERGSGRTTITHHSFAPPTHWCYPPPLPPAPENHDEGR